jgi:hypothetical protein
MPKNTDKIELETTVKFMRLSNGDDIISEISTDEKISMILTNPMRVIVDADLDVGKQTIYMHTWIPQGIVKGNVCRLSKKDVIFVAEVESDIYDYYRGVVFDIIEDKPPLKVEKEYIDDDKKVISFVNKNKDNKLN